MTRKSLKKVEQAAGVPSLRRTPSRLKTKPAKALKPAVKATQAAEKEAKPAEKPMKAAEKLAARGAKVLLADASKSKSVAPKAADEEAPEVIAEAEAAEPAGEDAASEALAELEAVAGSPDEEGAPEPAAREDDEPSNFLALYFREMAQLSVLRPEEEFESARKIEQLEIGLWAHLLAFPPLTEHLLRIVERTLENSLAEFRPLRRGAVDYRRKPSRPGAERLGKASFKASERIRALDIDKRVLDIAMNEVTKLLEHPEAELARAGAGPKHKAFRRCVEEASSTYERIQRAKNEFVKANLRLVVSIARRFNHGRMPLSDLIQEGNIGLMKAVERYDYRRGYRFSTYASWWIRHAISRALADKGRAVRLPVHMIDAYHRVARSKRELSGKLGRQPTSEELGTATGIASAKIEKMRTYLLDQSFSLDRPVSDEDGRKFIDFIQDPNADVAPTERLAEAAMTSEVRKLLDDLKPIEADILRRRFGLDDDQELTLKEIGEKYNLSRERIRQLQEQALLKMRRALQRKDLM